MNNKLTKLMSDYKNCHKKIFTRAKFSFIQNSKQRKNNSPQNFFFIIIQSFQPCKFCGYVNIIGCSFAKKENYAKKETEPFFYKKI